jgi:hypothetical protein
MIQAARVRKGPPNSNEETADIQREGYCEFISLHPVRVIDRNGNEESEGNAEVCSYHISRPVVAADGSTYALTCSRPMKDYADERNTVCAPFVATPALLATVGAEGDYNLRNGYAYMIGGYKTPFWVEAYTASRHHVCGEIG